MLVDMFPRVRLFLHVYAFIIVGLLGFGFLQSGAEREDVARVEVGGALVNGVVISLGLLSLERHIKQAVTERQTREQYQLALAMERDLTDRDFSGLKLSNLRLEGRDLHGSRFRGADLSRVDLSLATLKESDFSYADLRHAVLRGANLSNAEFDGADLSEADLRGADLSGAEMGTAKLSGASLPEVTISGTNMLLTNLGSFKGDSTQSGWYLAAKTNRLAASLIHAKWDPANPPIWPDGYTPPDNNWPVDATPQ